MNRFILTEEEKASLELKHLQCKDKKDSDRLKAVLLRSEGWTVPKISQALRVHQATIIRHVNEFHQGKLTNKSGGSEGKLNDEQTEKLIAHLEIHTYHHVHQIIQYIKEEWKIDFSIPGMNKWLHRHQFSYKKPKGHPHKADLAKQEEFIKTYTELKQSKPVEEPILFIDAVHPTQETKLSYGWIRTGKDKHVSTTASRTRMNIVGAIRLGQLDKTIIAEYETINADSIVSFMEKTRIKLNTTAIIHFILDQSGYHRSEKVKYAAKNLNIQLHFLPPYSQNLNPIERLWKVMNEKVRNNRFFERPKDFKDAIMEFFEKTLPNIAKNLDSTITDNFHLAKS